MADVLSQLSSFLPSHKLSVDSWPHGANPAEEKPILIYTAPGRILTVTYNVQYMRTVVSTDDWNLFSSWQYKLKYPLVLLYKIRKMCNLQQPMGSEEVILDNIVPLNWMFKWRSFPTKFTMTSDDVSQDEAVYSCHEGYQLVGVEKTYCQASGRWSGDLT